MRRRSSTARLRPARERYPVRLDERRDAMQASVGIRKSRTDLGDTAEYIANLRRGRRLQELRPAPG